MPRPTRLPGELAAVQRDLLRAARRMTGNADAAQDLTQDVFVKLWAKRRAGAVIDNMRAYAMTTLRNTYRQHLRARVSKTELEEDMITCPSRAFAALALSELDDAIARLPADQARLIRLVASGETSPADLARLTGLPSGTVMSRLARARATLRADMGLGGRAPVAELM